VLKSGGLMMYMTRTIVRGDQDCYPRDSYDRRDPGEDSPV
jgi:hypothetical protein